MPGKTSKKSGKVAKSAAKRVAAKAAKPRKAAVPSSDQMTASRRIDKAIADLGDWRGERLAEIRALIHEVDPEVVEEWKWMGSPVWSHQGMYALANPHKDKVKLTFFHGAKLADPKKILNTGRGGNTWRAIGVRRPFATSPHTRVPMSEARTTTNDDAVRSRPKRTPVEMATTIANVSTRVSMPMATSRANEKGGSSSIMALIRP